MDKAIIIIPILIILMIIIILIIITNKIKRKKNKVEEAFSTMDIYLKKRYDLIPNLIETVKAYNEHEKNTLTEIIFQRNYNNLKTNEKIKTNQEISGNITYLLALSEKYPELKANENFHNLTENISKVEDEIAHSRKYYNASVREYNTLIEIFPNNIIANIFGFKKMEMYSITEEEKENIKVGDLNEKNN